MPKSLYLINPDPDFPSYFGAEAYRHWGGRPAVAIADLATATVAAFAPPDWEVRICEEHVQPIDFDVAADYVGITGKITQGPRMISIATEFRRRGKTVIIGGPYASLSPQRLRDHCDILVIGEIEAIAGELFADLEASSWKQEYRGNQPALDSSPMPRWDLYPNERALAGCVQTSRGCPFECEFCDVIQYLGRKQRHKPIPQILTELDILYDLGYREVFLADDNFTVYRKRAKQVLAALSDWNSSRTEGPVAFGTQLSIDAARDPEIMELLSAAGMVWVFIGIETPNAESLRETKKRQNLGVDLEHEVQVFLDHGVSVIGGMIVGFDSDGPDIFQRQLDFAMATSIPIFSVGALVAPDATPLKTRMADSGRLLEAGSEVAALPWDTNIVPSQLDREQLLGGLKWVCNQLYSPDNFGRRVVGMIERIAPLGGPFASQPHRSPRAVDAEALNLIKKVVRLGSEERQMWKRIFAALSKRPEAEPAVLRALARYVQIRCLYDVGEFWEPRLSERPFSAEIGELRGADAGKGLVTLGGGTTS